MKYHAYLASGWFSAAQESSRQEILDVMKEIDLTFYSPREEIECLPDANAETRHSVFEQNTNAIRESMFVIVNTQDKDMGTIFEAGYASALSKPIFYYCSGLTGKFNLMLAESGIAVATNKDELAMHLQGFFLNEGLYRREYVGHIE